MPKKALRTIWEMLDLKGKVILSEPPSAEAGLKEYQLDLSHLAKGVYMLSMKSANDSWMTLFYTHFR